MRCQKGRQGQPKVWTLSQRVNQESGSWKIYGDRSCARTETSRLWGDRYLRSSLKAAPEPIRGKGLGPAGSVYWVKCSWPSYVGYRAKALQWTDPVHGVSMWEWPITWPQSSMLNQDLTPCVRLGMPIWPCLYLLRNNFGPVHARLCWANPEWGPCHLTMGFENLVVGEQWQCLLPPFLHC